MISEQHVNTLRSGDVFRDWLVDVIGDRIQDKKCKVAVYKLSPASHTICRYDFQGENYGVVAKFYAEPTGWKRDYDPVRSMKKEFDLLKRVGHIIDVPRPLAIRKDFHCVLVTEYVRGKPLFSFMKTEKDLYDKLTAMAETLRKLHDSTKSHYRKQDEFGRFHKVLDQLKLDGSIRLEYNRLLGDWWYSTLIDQPYGCLIHNDPNPVNYVFGKDKVYLLDLESSWNHANFIHDLGVIAAELKHYFSIHKGDSRRAEPYIGHFLWNYSQSMDEFLRITKALPFFMSLGFLRMARLDLDKQGSASIFAEAIGCLKAKH